MVNNIYIPDDNPKFIDLKASILKHTENVFLPKNNIKFKNSEIESCFEIYRYVDDKYNILYPTLVDPKKYNNKLFAAYCIDLYFSDNDKFIIDKWLNSCISAENIAISFFKTLLKNRIEAMNNKADILNFINEVKLERSKIELLLKKSQYNKIYINQIKEYNEKLIDLNIRLVEKHNTYLNAIKNEKIWWLNELIRKNYGPTLDYYTKLRDKLSNPDYIKNRNNDLNDLTIKINILKNMKSDFKYSKCSFIDNKILEYVKQYAILRDEFKPKIDPKIIRSHLYHQINDVYNKSKIEITKNKKTTTLKIKKHILDESTKQVCTSIKSMITNYENGNIDRFKLKKRKMNKESKNMILERAFFKKRSIFGTIFKSVKCEKDGKEFNIFDVYDEKVTCNLVYDDSIKKYKLYVPKKIEKEQTTKAKTLSCDFGLRTFITAISENEVIEIGKQSDMKLKKYVDKLRKIKNIKTKVRKRKKKMIRIRRKIKYISNELHWKTINFITKNYGAVMVGNMSAKNIVNKEGNLERAQKDLTHALSFYKFKMRLEYKCATRGVKYYNVNEYGTSKICSKCGKYNNIGGSKTYECKKCGLKIDRDINSARSIKMKTIK